MEHLEATPQGRDTLQRGYQLASKVKGAIALGVSKAIESVDADSMGALSALIHNIKQRDLGGAYHASNALMRSIFTNVHQEIFENALAQHTGLPGAHALGKLAAKGAAAAEQGLLLGVAWSWGKVAGKHAEGFDEDTLNHADRKLIAALTQIAAQALAEIYRAAGVVEPKIDTAPLAQRIASSLLADAKEGKPSNFSEGINTLNGMEIFAVGEHRGKVYTRQDLDDMVRNFEQFCTGQKPGFHVPLVIGHEETQEFLDRSDLPAAGWCLRIWRDGDKLLADFEDVPEEIKELLDAKAYRTVSSEVYDKPPEGIAGMGKMLRRVALLGGDLPQLKDLKDIPRVQSHGENRRFARWRRVTLRLHTIEASRTPGAYWCFSEARSKPMTMKALLDALKRGRSRRLQKFAERYDDDPPRREDLLDLLSKLGMDTGTIKDVPDEALAEMVRVMADRHDDYDDEPLVPDEKYDEADGADGLAPHALDNLPEPKDMSERRKFAEHARRYADRVRRHAERAKKYMERYCDMSRHADDPPEPRPEPKPSEPPVDKHREQEQMRSLIRQEIRSALDGEVKTSLSKLEKFREQQEASQKQLTVETFCEAQIKAGRLTPAEYTSRAAGGPDGPVYRRLLRADAAKVHKFAEGGKSVERTDLDDQMKEIENRPTLFGERFRDPKPAAGSDSDAESVVLTHFDKFSEDYKRAGYNRDKFLKEFKDLNDQNRASMLEHYRASLQT